MIRIILNLNLSIQVKSPYICGVIQRVILAMSTPIIMPKQGQSVETCIINEWFVKKGDLIKKGDKLYSYETDKAIFEVEAETEGKLLEIFFHGGDEVPVLVNVAVVGKEGEEVESFRPGKTATESKAATVVEKAEAPIIIESAPRGSEVLISPRAKKLAGKFNINYWGIAGSGANKRIIEQDILNLMESGKVMTKLASQVSQEQGMPIATHTAIGGRASISDLAAAETSGSDFELVKLSNMRKIIAQKMQASLQNSAQLTHHISANASQLMAAREKVKERISLQGGANITINDFVCFAIIKALQIKPAINCHFMGDAVKQFKKVHLGIAVQTERGLLVPILRNAGELSLSEISTQLKTLADNCKKGSVEPSLLDSQNATFTVSNLGSFGIESFTPILNIPQAGIMGVNAITLRHTYNERKEIVLAPHIGLSLTYDHRVIDGAPASEFLAEVKKQIENLRVE